MDAIWSVVAIFALAGGYYLLWEFIVLGPRTPYDRRRK